MISPPAGTRIYPACGVTDMRKGFDGRVGLRVKQKLPCGPADAYQRSAALAEDRSNRSFRRSLGEARGRDGSGSVSLRIDADERHFAGRMCMDELHWQSAGVEVEVLLARAADPIVAGGDPLAGELDELVAEITGTRAVVAG